ncbi:MAG: sigma-70 family RNA polymerase sigma factor [Planctomycetota bacterium]
MRLVQAVHAGDEAAREALFSRYLPRVAHMVAAQLGVSRRSLPAAAEDVAQDALLHALQGLGGFEMKSPGAFAVWLKTIVLNCVRHRWRKEHATPERCLWQRYGDLDLRESFFAGASPTPSSHSLASEDNQRVEQALQRLPQLYRLAIVGRFLGEMSHAELAQHLGHTEVYCRKLVQRGIDLLRVDLARGG